VSKKSTPGDGTHGNGTKGGNLYGGHMAVKDASKSPSLVIALVNLAQLRRRVARP